MRIFGLEFGRKKALPVAAQGLQTVPGSGGWFRIFESFAGAWQQHVQVDSQQSILANGAVFSCVTAIAADVGKLRPKLMRRAASGVWQEFKDDEQTPFRAVLRKPNHYQNRIKFIECWIASKLMHGNTYVIKERDDRGVVRALYILDPCRVTPLITPSGDVYYQIAADNLSGIGQEVVVAADEVIHDLMVPLWHPLVGVSPLYACAMSATMGNKIQANSATFFKNMSRPSGMLTAPGRIGDDTADRMKRDFQERFSGENLGRLLVGGDGLEFKAFTMPAEQAQLIEQLRWTVEDVARAFHLPLFKIGGPVPPATSVEALNQAYYSDVLQGMIESLELCLDEGLSLPNEYCVELDLDGLLRMDQTAQMTVLKEGVKGSILAPNEARAKLDLPPVIGGDSPMGQHQDYSLAALAKRDASEDPFGKAQPAAQAPAANDDGAKRAGAAKRLEGKFEKALEAAA